MSTNYANHVSKKVTSQIEPIIGEKQVKNNAGGYVFELSKWDYLDRFLVLGSEGGTYYASEKKLTIDNANNVLACIQENGRKVVDTIVEISDTGRAPKNDPALFVLALCASFGDEPTRQYALSKLSKVARIGTHLFHFAEFVNAQRGWGRALKRAVANWYLDKPIDGLVNQVTKYQQRDGWSNRDLLRLSHPKTEELSRKAVFDWVCGRTSDSLPYYLLAFEALKEKPSVQLSIELINKYNFPRELIPTELLNDVDVWKALLVNMPMTALIRNLNKMTAIGLLKPLSKEINDVVEKLTNSESIRKSRLHPLSILTSLKQYSQGAGDKGKLTWKPEQRIVDALNDAFYKSFGNVTPTGKNIMLCLDVSGSMTMGGIAGSSVNPREGSAAMALITASIEKNYHIMGFSSELVPLNVSHKMRLNDVIKTISGLRFGSTDCAQPMIYAMNHNLDVDAFIVYTDNETWCGKIHPIQALKEYRKKSGRNAKLIVVGMTSTGFSIADPKDTGMMDVVGFDSAAPEVMSNFIRN